MVIAMNKLLRLLTDEPLPPDEPDVALSRLLGVPKDIRGCPSVLDFMASLRTAVDHRFQQSNVLNALTREQVPVDSPKAPHVAMVAVRVQDRGPPSTLWDLTNDASGRLLVEVWDRYNGHVLEHVRAGELFEIRNFHKEIGDRLLLNRDSYAYRRDIFEHAGLTMDEGLARFAHLHGDHGPSFIWIKGPGQLYTTDLQARTVKVHDPTKRREDTELRVEMSFGFEEGSYVRLEVP